VSIPHGWRGGRNGQQQIPPLAVAGASAPVGMKELILGRHYAALKLYTGGGGAGDPRSA